jgi:hypothetical protein
MRNFQSDLRNLFLSCVFLHTIGNHDFCRRQIDPDSPTQRSTEFKSNTGVNDVQIIGGTK